MLTGQKPEVQDADKAVKADTADVTTDVVVHHDDLVLSNKVKLHSHITLFAKDRAVHRGVLIAPGAILHKLGPSLHYVVSSPAEFMTAYHHDRVAVLCLSDARACANNCGKTESSFHLRLCGRCRTVSYCSRECQRADWPLHKPACVPVVHKDEQ
jgi:hypothetical protein